MGVTFPGGVREKELREDQCNKLQSADMMINDSLIQPSVGSELELDASLIAKLQIIV